MNTQVTCPACSAILKTKGELAGKRVRCPRCQAPIPVPRTTPVEKEPEVDSPVPRWLVLGAVLLISLTLGAAGGFVAGLRQGKSGERRELAEAQSQSKALSDKLMTAESKTAGIQAERDRLQLKLAAAVKDHESKLAEAKRREDAASARARTAEEKLAAATAAEAEALARLREEKARKTEASKKVQKVDVQVQKVDVQNKALPQLLVTGIKVGESYKTDGGSRKVAGPGNTWGKVLQVIDDDNMLIGIDNGGASPGGNPRYSVTVWCKFPTNGITDGKTNFLAKIIGTNQVTATGTTRYNTTGGGTRTVFVLEPYGKQKK